jgi:hypothetical protein
MHKAIPVVHLCGNVVWFSADFLRQKVAYMVKTAVGNADVSPFQQAYVKQMDNTFTLDVNRQYKQVTTWMVRMESNLTNRADMRNILNTRISLLITVFSHLLLSLSLSLSLCVCVCVCVAHIPIITILV